MNITKEDLIRIYNNGYDHGHNDTVEGLFVDIAYKDMHDYHIEEVEKLIKEVGS